MLTRKPTRRHRHPRRSTQPAPATAVTASSRSRRSDRQAQRGSGTAIGVAIIFPMLMLVIVAIQALSEASRLEQAVQTSANRAARTASLCCLNIEQAEEAATASLHAAEGASAANRVYCNNDFAGDATVVFIGPGDVEVRPNANRPVPVPPGGTVYVTVRCVLPPQQLGAYGLPGLNVERRAIGTASIDPYRHRQDQPDPPVP